MEKMKRPKFKDYSNLNSNKQTGGCSRSKMLSVSVFVVIKSLFSCIFQVQPIHIHPLLVPEQDYLRCFTEVFCISLSKNICFNRPDYYYHPPLKLLVLRPVTSSDLDTSRPLMYIPTAFR